MSWGWAGRTVVSAPVMERIFESVRNEAPTVGASNDTKEKDA